VGEASNAIDAVEHIDAARASGFLPSSSACCMKGLLFISYCPYTYCIPSHDSASVLSYQWLPMSIQCGEAMARRQKEDRQGGHRIPWNGEAMGSFLLPWAPQGGP
jgi:hypothetical protein